MEPVTRSTREAFPDGCYKAQGKQDRTEKGMCWLLLPGRWHDGSSGSRLHLQRWETLSMLPLPLHVVSFPLMQVGVLCWAELGTGPR